MAQQIISKTFQAASGILNSVKKVLPLNIGLPLSSINAKNSKYVVVITAENPKMNMFAFLQDKFSFSVSSDWTDSAPMTGLFAATSDLVQIGTGHTLMNTLATRRKWRGSSPVSINMKLKFEAFSNVKSEVLDPCRKLQALALPSKGIEAAGSQWFLVPPGPNPFFLPGVGGAVGEFTNFGPGDFITVTIGDFVTFSNVIISSVDVVYESRMSVDGPVGAEVTVVFQTYEMLTKESLETAYGGAPVTSQVPGFKQTLVNAVKTLTS